jgi:hypothetical protein
VLKIEGKTRKNLGYKMVEAQAAQSQNELSGVAGF